MQIQKFLNLLTYKSNSDEIKRIIKSHPLQWIDTSLDIPIWEIKYKYTTVNGKNKEHVKYIIAKEGMWDAEAEHYFNNWLEDYNKKHPYRALSNVEILEMNYIEDVELVLE